MRQGKQHRLCSKWYERTDINSIGCDDGTVIIVSTFLFNPYLLDINTWIFTGGMFWHLWFALNFSGGKKVVLLGISYVTLWMEFGKKGSLETMSHKGIMLGFDYTKAWKKKYLYFRKIPRLWLLLFIVKLYWVFNILFISHFQLLQLLLQTWRDEKTWHNDMKQVHSIYRTFTLTEWQQLTVCVEHQLVTPLPWSLLSTVCCGLVPHPCSLIHLHVKVPAYFNKSCTYF